MGDLETYDWIGVTGQRYTYSVYNLPANFVHGEFGNYIFAKSSSNDEWIPIFIGQGDLGVEISDDHPMWKCIKQRGATHVHVHLNDSEWVRVSEEEDLLENYLSAFEPYGCNRSKEESEEEYLEDNEMYDEFD